tara:strand:- start:136 stop:432 length:297 start_codon:yes stop_codon:yes gene_type:complete
MRRRNKKSNNITMSELRKLVMEETAKLTGELEDVEAVEAEEIEADGYADTLASDIDMYKAMQVESKRLRKQYRKLVREARKVRKNKLIAKKRILRRLK